MTTYDHTDWTQAACAGTDPTVFFGRPGRAAVVRGDARHLPLPDGSVDLICTSPPYFALRSYTDGGQHYDGQIGSEATPAEFLDALWACTREWVRVLKPTGSLFVNLGDSYAGQAPGRQGASGQRADRASANEPYRARARRADDVRTKSLRGLPWRYALGCIDQLGLILRAEIIWDKPNGLPESVTDRARRSHEQWFHFTLQPRYYSAVDEIREPHGEPHRISGKPEGGGNRRGGKVNNGFGLEGMRDRLYNPLGKLPGSVWEIPSEPLNIPDRISHACCCNGRKRKGCEDGLDHFAAFPTEWPRRIISGWSPAGICLECGEGRRPVAERCLTVNRGGRQSQRGPSAIDGGSAGQTLGYERIVTIPSYACACPEPTAPTRPAVIVDPFGGTGTTALVAKALGRIGITVDRSGDYCRLAAWRITDREQLAKAMRVDKPPKQVTGQADLFADGEAS